MKRIIYIFGAAAVLAGLMWWYMHTGGPQNADAPSKAVAAVPNAVPGAATIVAEGTKVAPGTAIAINPSGTIVDPGALDADVPPPSGYIEYRNIRYGFSFYHSPAANITVYDEGGGASTVVLENVANPARARGMQVFIVPYSEATISEERFKRDVPSGVRANVENTTVDGVRAVTFLSKDTLLGDTREIWFIRGGYLYEVTTFKGVAAWFQPIMQSWRFI